MADRRVALDRRPSLTIRYGMERNNDRTDPITSRNEYVVNRFEGSKIRCDADGDR